ncbi:MAG: DUF58 domain-containing protein [Candidatus Dormibacteria bacterium]
MQVGSPAVGAPRSPAPPRRFRRASRASGALGAIERTTGITASGLILLGFCVGAWIAGKIMGGRAIYLLAYCGVALLAAAYYMARRKRPVTAERSSLARRAREGQVLEVELTLRADRRITTFVLEEKVHPHLGSTVRVPIATVAPGHDVKHSYSISPRLRGVYQVGPLTAEFSDPFGLARRQQLLTERTEIIVHPRTDDVLDRPLTRGFEDPPLRPPNSRAWPEGFEFYGMREYVRGDDMRRVVWRAFARTEKLLVREFEQGIGDRISVVVDTDRSWHSPGNPSDTFETAVRVAASVGTRHIKDGFSTRLESNYAELGGFRGPRARLPFLDQLAGIHMSKEPLEDALTRLVRNGRRDAHVVVVTSHFSSLAAAQANLLISGGASLTVAAVVWEESDPVSMRRAREIGAQVVPVKPGASLRGVFRASLQTNIRMH